jgi:hypothetical protein
MILNIKELDIMIIFEFLKTLKKIKILFFYILLYFKFENL